MSKLIVEIDMDNAAFDDDASGEVYQCLRRVISAIDRAPTWEPGRNAVRDSNGNTVGFWEYQP